MSSTQVAVVQIAGAVRNTLSAARLGTYEAIAAAAGRDAEAAVALYAWNAQISGALLPPLHLCEVAIRNAVSDALEALYGARWPWNPTFERSLPRQSGPGYNALADLQQVRNKATSTGQVITELKFVFWEKMFTSRHDGRVWNPHLMRVLPNLDQTKTVAALRLEIHNDLNNIRLLRNRIAHHEPVLQRNLQNDLGIITRLVESRCQVSSGWMMGFQQVQSLIGTKPF
ncbi:Abi family protein [uncultured Pseudomonas sp.]|uniref:Abi family protein n=1 Tax=uncultured Pseudomonas sp. TaxID=114707 RepID=UPI002583C3E0|nr:Abi family protein [uncultured Pseudomonas sp.]